MSTWRFKIRDPSSFSTVKATLDPTTGSKVFNPTWRHPYRGLGSGGFTLQNDDTDYGDIADGDLVICEKNDTPIFGWIVQSRNRVSVAKAAEAGLPSGEKYTTFSGPGLKACGLRSPVRPFNTGTFRPKETVRAFDWTSAGFDFSSWADAEEIKRVDEVSAHWQGTPQFTPDPTIFWIGEAGASDDDAESGARLARAQRFILDEQSIVSFFGWIDNEGIGYLNTVEIMRIDTFHECRYRDLLLPPGEYDFSMFGRNLEDTALSDGANPFAFAFGIYKRTSDGAFVETIMVSDSSTKILALPSTTPGLDLGAAPRILLEENQALGELPGLGLNFTDTTSTNGATFPAAVDAAAVVKETFTDYVLALEDSVADVEINPASYELELYYPKGSRGSPQDVTFTDGVSLQRLQHEIRDDRVTKLFIDYDGGYIEVGSGEFCKPLTLSQVPAEDAAIRIGEAVLDGRDTPSKRFNADIVTGAGREPYDDFLPGDTVTVDDEDGSGAEILVQAIVLKNVDKGGNPMWAAEFGDPLEPLETIADRAVRKFAATRSATNVQNALPSIQGAGGEVYQQQIHEFSYEPSDLQITQQAEAKATRDLAYLSVVMDDTDTESHTFRVRVNGVALTDLDVTITAGNIEGKSWADIGEYRVFAGEGGDKITLEFSGGPIRFTAKLAYR